MEEPNMAKFTCISCRVRFNDADLQRAHYKSDWHRYNLKRKVAELPPITSEEFIERVKAQQEKVVNAQEVFGGEYCEACHKHFRSQNQYDNHLRSKKHQEATAKYNAVMERQRTESEASSCISTASERVKKKNERNLALKQASNDSSTGAVAGGAGAVATGSSEACAAADDDIDDEMEVDSDDDWDYETLGEEECLFCSHISKDFDKNIEHMTMKHSFFIPDAEYLVDLPGLVRKLGELIATYHWCLWCHERSRNFDSIQATKQHMLDKGHCKMLYEGDALAEYSDFYDYRSSYPDAAEKDDDEDSELPTPAVTQEDLLSNYELTLPSGATIGHRSLAVYFKQNYGWRGSSPRATVKLLSTYKALGWTGTTGKLAVKNAKDVHYMQRIRHKHRMQLGVKANKFQKHYRPQVVF